MVVNSSIYPNDGFDNFFLISFCVSRKNNAYGETGLLKRKTIEFFKFWMSNWIQLTFEVHLDLYVSSLFVSFSSWFLLDLNYSTRTNYLKTTVCLFSNDVRALPFDALTNHSSEKFHLDHLLMIVEVIINDFHVDIDNVPMNQINLDKKIP